MVQEQLVDYVSSQMKLGVSRDAIKSALVGAGWIAADVEDTLKKVDGGNGSAMQASSAKPAQQPAAVSMSTNAASPASSSSSPSVAASASAKPATSPQTIRVSDLVSSSAISSAQFGSSPASKVDASKFPGKISGNSFEASPSSVSMKSSGGKGSLVMGIVGGVVVVLLAGLAWYFYSKNDALAQQVTSLNAQAASVNAQLTALQSQVDASSTGLAAQVASLTAANEDLALNLSFFAVPSGDTSSTAAAPLPVTISGWLSLSKTTYAITTPRGAKIFIANSTDAKIAPQLKPLVGDTVQAVGTYVQGSDAMTVTSVSNLSPAAPTSTATSTATDASTTMMAATSTAASSTP